MPNNLWPKPTDPDQAVRALAPFLNQSNVSAPEWDRFRYVFKGAACSCREAQRQADKGRACLSEASLHGPPPDASIAGCLFARANRSRAVGPPSLLNFLRPAIRAEQDSECAAGRMSRPPHPNPQAPPARCTSNASTLPSRHDPHGQATARIRLPSKPAARKVSVP